MAVIHPQRVRLAHSPTPLIRLEQLGRELDADIWLKRDDMTGLEISGNKIRKLEYVIADLLRLGCDTLLTEGTPQSNHCRAAATACAKLGLHCHLLFRPPPPPGWPQGNYLIDTLFGATVSSYEWEAYFANQDRIVAQEMERLRSAGREPRYTPMGASEPLGCWGYIRGAAELAEQLYQAKIGECDIVLAVSSGGTYAGLLLGRWIHRLYHWNLWAVPVSDNVDFQTKNIRRLTNAAIEQFKLPAVHRESDLRFLDGYVGEGYAIPYQEELDEIRLLARTEAILLDPVYTGKAFHALLDGVRAGYFGKKRPVVFLHTGGIFSDFAWPELLLQGLR